MNNGFWAERILINAEQNKFRVHKYYAEQTKVGSEGCVWFTESKWNTMQIMLKFKSLLECVFCFRLHFFMRGNRWYIPDNPHNLQERVSLDAKYLVDSGSVISPLKVPFSCFSLVSRSSIRFCLLSASDCILMMAR